MEGAYLTTSIKEIVVEMSDTPLKQILRRRRSAMCCIMTPAAPASQWKTVLMFSITATLPLHQDPSNMFWQVNVVMHTSSEGHYTSWRETDRVACIVNGNKVKTGKCFWIYTVIQLCFNNQTFFCFSICLSSFCTIAIVMRRLHLVDILPTSFQKVNTPHNGSF